MKSESATHFVGTRPSIGILYPVCWKDISLIMVLVACFGLGSTTYAQVMTGTILGTVRDQTGGVVPGVTVTAELVEQGVTRSTVTNDRGQYTLSFLQVGVYLVTAELQGFKTPVHSNVKVDIDHRLRLDLNLEVGDVQDEVMVVGEVTPLSSESSNISEVFSDDRVVDIPLKGRNFIDLVTLTPGATSEVAGTFGTQFALAGTSANVNGNRSDSNNFLLNGVPINDTLWGRMATAPSVDAIQEMKVQSADYSSEFGTAGGGQINITMKSGQNDFHGSAFWFFRRDVFDARNFFAPEKPPFEQDQYGVSIGGPIVEDQSFFFFNYEGIRLDKGLTLIGTVPNDQLRSGDFSGLAPIFDPFNVDPVTGARIQFPNNIIPQDRIHPVSQDVLGVTPRATDPAAASRNFIGIEDQVREMDQFNFRVDHQFSDNDSIFGHFNWTDLANIEPGGGAQTGGGEVGGLPGFAPNVELKTRNLGITWTHVISPSTINQARAGYTRTNSLILTGSPDRNFSEEAGIQGTSKDPRVFGVPQFRIGGFTTIGDSGSTLNGIANDFNYVDDLSHTYGSHSLKMGVAVSRLQTNPFFLPASRGTFVYTDPIFSEEASVPGSGHPFADFLLGLPNQGTAGQGDPQVYGRAWRSAFYLQDDWRVTPRLTLNLGIRYEYLTPPVEKFDRLSNFDFQTGQFFFPCENGSPSSPKADVEAFPSLTFACADELGLGRGLSKADQNDWAPRIGFAYSIVEGKLVLRAGYGIFYSYPPMAVRFGTPSFNAPFLKFSIAPNSVTNPAFTDTILVDPGLVITVGQPFSTNYLTGYVQQWNLNLQYQAGRSTMLEATYIGSKGTKLNAQRHLNQTKIETTGQKAWDFLSASAISSGPFGWSTYHSLQLRAHQRYQSGLSFVTHYSWSKSIDTSSLILSNASNTQVPQNAFDLPSEYGRSFFMNKHRFVFSGLYELPFGINRPLGANMSRGLDALVGNWRVSVATTVSTGFPFSPRIAADRSGSGSRTDRPNAVGDPNDISNRTAERFFNTDAFELQTPGTFGNAGRNTIDGPGFNSVDIAIIKDFPTYEDQRLQFRAEFFNAFNRVNFDPPNRTSDSPSFGQIFSAQDGRVIQFAFKYIF